MDNPAALPDFYNVKILKIYVAYLRDELNWSQAAIEDLFEQCEADIGMLDYDDNWFNQDLADRFHDLVCHLTGDPDIAYKVGQYSTHQTAKGIVGRLMAGLLSPVAAYKNVAKISKEYSKGAVMSAVNVSTTHAVIKSVPAPLCDEKPYQCRNRTGILESIPTFFNLPGALIDENKCFHKGDDCCEYSVTWVAQPYRTAPLIAIILFIVLSVFFYTQALPTLLSLLLSVGISGTIYTFINQLSTRGLTRALNEQIEALRISHDTLERRHKESSLVSEINQYVNRVVTIDTLCDVLSYTIHEKMGYDRVTIFLHDPTTNTLTPASYVGFNRHDAEILNNTTFHVRQDVVDGLLISVMNTGESIFVRDMEKIILNLSERSKIFVNALQVKSYTAVPIKFENTIFGIIAVDNVTKSKHLTENDKLLLESVATPIGVSFSNAKTYEKLQSSKNLLEDLVNERTQELVLARDEAVRANNAKSQFLANMSHELRSPLNAIMGFSQLINFEAASKHYDQIAEDSKKVITSSEHLLSLISDLLDLSKIESGKMELYIEELNPVTVVSDILDMAEALARPNRNRFDVKKLINIPTIYADEKKLKQILLNLVSNACKFTSDGTITLTVDLNQEDKDYILFEVCDTGIGISDENQKKLFNEFTQADSTTTKKYGGTGLGLSLCKKFTEMMGGKIVMESVEHVGTCFSLSIPIQTCNNLTQNKNNNINI